jgi:hypothetical protein
VDRVAGRLGLVVGFGQGLGDGAVGLLVSCATGSPFLRDQDVVAVAVATTT